MSKVRIVQISACFDNDGNSGSEYLDDEGRVWYMSGRWEKDGKPSNEEGRQWVNTWFQLDLPDDPGSSEKGKGV